MAIVTYSKPKMNHSITKKTFTILDIKSVLDDINLIYGFESFSNKIFRDLKISLSNSNPKTNPSSSSYSDLQRIIETSDDRNKIYAHIASNLELESRSDLAEFVINSFEGLTDDEFFIIMKTAIEFNSNLRNLVERTFPDNLNKRLFSKGAHRVKLIFMIENCGLMSGDYDMVFPVLAVKHYDFEIVLLFLTKCKLDVSPLVLKTRFQEPLYRAALSNPSYSKAQKNEVRDALKIPSTFKFKAGNIEDFSKTPMCIMNHWLFPAKMFSLTDPRFKGFVETLIKLSEGHYEEPNQGRMHVFKRVIDHLKERISFSDMSDCEDFIIAIFPNQLFGEFLPGILFYYPILQSYLEGCLSPRALDAISDTELLHRFVYLRDKCNLKINPSNVPQVASMISVMISKCFPVGMSSLVEDIRRNFGLNVENIPIFRKAIEAIISKEHIDLEGKNMFMKMLMTK